MDFPSPDNLSYTPPSADTQNLNQETAAPATEAAPNDQTTQQNNPAQAVGTLTELDKLEKFKLDGQEWTPKTIKDAILRQQDYSKKTAALAKEREAFASEQKYHDNIVADLDIIRKNPHLASEFIKVYPQKFHAYLKNVLEESRQTTGEKTQQEAQRPQYDVDAQSRIHKLESRFHEQEVAKNTQEINGYIDKFSKKYPDAFSELALANVYKAYEEGEQVTEELFERSFKQVNEMVETRFKSRYGDLVKKQTSANKKAQDVDAGGGTPGKAPQKFKNFDEITNFAVNSLKGQR